VVTARHRSEQRIEPCHVPYVVEAPAEVRGLCRHTAEQGETTASVGHRQDVFVRPGAHDPRAARGMREDPLLRGTPGEPADDSGAQRVVGKY
jgi:hypothetical protein